MHVQLRSLMDTEKYFKEYAVLPSTNHISIKSACMMSNSACIRVHGRQQFDCFTEQGIAVLVSSSKVSLQH